jgi:hypothetical protein
MAIHIFKGNFPVEYTARDPRHQVTPAQRGPPARPPRRMNGHSLPSVLGTRLSPLLEGLGPPSARPRPGPGGSRPRRTNSARTTSRPVTRISRVTGDPPPTPYHVLGTRRTQLSTRTTPSPDTAGSTGESGDSDTITKARHYKKLGYDHQGKTL